MIFSLDFDSIETVIVRLAKFGVSGQAVMLSSLFAVAHRVFSSIEILL